MRRFVLVVTVLAAAMLSSIAGMIATADAAQKPRSCGSFKEVSDGFYVAEWRKFKVTGMSCTAAKRVMVPGALKWKGTSQPTFNYSGWRITMRFGESMEAINVVGKKGKARFSATKYGYLEPQPVK